MKKKVLIPVSLLLVGIISLSAVNARNFDCMNNLLTNEQSEEVHELMEEMREDNLSPNEIKEAVNEKMAEYGVELPERKEMNREERPEFTDEERDEMLQNRIEKLSQVQEMRQSGYTWEEIHEEMEFGFQEMHMHGQRPHMMGMMVEE